MDGQFWVILSAVVVDVIISIYSYGRLVQRVKDIDAKGSSGFSELAQRVARIEGRLGIKDPI